MKEDKGGEVDFGLNGGVVWAAFGAGGGLWKHIWLAK